MSYRDFTLNDIKTKLGLTVHEYEDLFAEIPVFPVSDALQATLQEHVPLALAINTEKARSELIITPVLVEVRRLLNRQISLFSGVDFSIEPEKGLNGVCDFILSRSPEQLSITAPVLLLVEAKNENIKGGIFQCIAAMVAAHIFNEREGNGVDAVYGVVTSGNIWKFLKLSGNDVWVDRPEYYINQVGAILAIMVHIVGQGNC